MDIRVWEKNMVSLMKHNKLIFEDIKDMNFEDIEDIDIHETANGLKTISVFKDSKNYFLHSLINPIEDAERILSGVDFNRDSLIVAYGMGIGYHLFELKKKITKGTRVIIVEYNLNVLKYCLANIDLTELLNSPQFLIICGDESMLKRQIPIQVGYNFYNLAYNIQNISLPNYYIYSKLNLFVMKSITNNMNTNVIYKGNALDDIIDGFRNNYLNIDAIIKSNSVEEVKDKYKNKPAIIVASGPSLEKNIHHLKKAYGKALIISCDASLRACEVEGIVPDAVASIERVEATYKFYYKDKKIDPNVVLVGPGLLWPDIFKEYRGKTVIMSKFHEGIDGWWYKHFENIKFVNQGHSCATVAFAFAKEAGCNPIILIGQDLAYTYGKKHSDITHTEHEGENDDRDSISFGEVYLEDYNGNPIKSSYIFKIFKEWYEAHILYNPNLKVINATEGGANIKGAELMSFNEAIDIYCKNPLENQLTDYLKDVEISNEEYIEKYKFILGSIQLELENLNTIKNKAKKHYNKLIDLNSKLNEKATENQLYKIAKDMKKGDGVVSFIFNKQPNLKTFYDQIITQTIIQVKKLGNELTYQNLARNLELQGNLMYIIEKSSELIIKEYEKMSELITSKKMERLSDDYESSL